MTVSCRPATPDDEPFLRALILETIAEELGADAWPQPLRDQILGLQYRTRRGGSVSPQAGTSSAIIVADGEDAGWLLTAELDDEIRIVEIMVRTARRGQGIGSTGIQSLLARAAAVGKPVRLLVNSTNAGAIRLYQRLGFRTTGGNEVQHNMEWRK